MINLKFVPNLRGGSEVDHLVENRGVHRCKKPNNQGLILLLILKEGRNDDAADRIFRR